MNKILSIVVATLFITISARGQNLLLIEDQSFPSTENYILQSNPLLPAVGDLNVMFAKDGNTALLAVSQFSNDELEIRGRLIIYLNDGSVVKLKPKLDDFVDNTTKAVYELTQSELNLLLNSNINTIRYTLEHEEYRSAHPGTGTYIASNKGDSKVDFTTVASNFFNK